MLWRGDRLPDPPKTFKPKWAPKPKDTRPSASKRGYGSRWQQARKRYLARHPLCVECKKEGRLQAASVVDHIIPHDGDQVLMWDVNNWQSLCASHHSRKTVTQDGGFGRKRD